MRIQCVNWLLSLLMPEILYYFSFYLIICASFLLHRYQEHLQLQSQATLQSLQLLGLMTFLYGYLLRPLVAVENSQTGAIAHLMTRLVVFTVIQNLSHIFTLLYNLTNLETTHKTQIHMQCIFHFHLDCLATYCCLLYCLH